MKYSLLLLTVAVIDFSLNINGLPVPAGQIINIRVPSKYFNQPSSDGTSSTTLSTAEGSNSLYDFLLHKHFGAGEVEEGKKDVMDVDDSAAVTSTLSTLNISELSGEGEEEEVDEEQHEIEEVSSTMQNMQDFSETSPSAISEEQEEEDETPTTSSTAVKDDSLPELIKKVVNEQLEKLVSENEPISSTESDQSDNDVQTAATTEDNVASAVAEDDNTTPSVDSKETTTAAEEQDEEDDEVHEEQDEVDKLLPESDPLLGAVTDLLSSILGLQFEQKLLLPNDDVTEDEPVRTTTEKVIIDEPKVAEEEAAATTIKSTNEIDMMIENLASSVGFATEESPTFVESLLVTESDDAPRIEAAITTTTASADEIQKDNLIELDKIAEEVEEMKKLVALRQRINQVMDLVKRTEEDLKLNSNQPQSNDDDDVVSGTLKELHSNLGISDDSVYETMPSNTDKIRNIESTINESLINKISHQDEQVFLPNAAKAALRYKYYDNHDF